MSIVESAGDALPEPLSKQDKEMARVAQSLIMASLDHSRAATIVLNTDTGEHPTISLPPASLKLIGRLLGALSTGRPFTVLPQKQEFTTLEAANFLNVSRPFVSKEIAAGRLPHRMVGTHRRIPVQDLIAYADKMRAGQADALDTLADIDNELGLDY
ncbi:MAG: excisionase family DNA-binding protein [Pseudomonadota bacterium]